MCVCVCVWLYTAKQCIQQCKRTYVKLRVKNTTHGWQCVCVCCAVLCLYDAHLTWCPPNRYCQRAIVCTRHLWWCAYCLRLTTIFVLVLVSATSSTVATPNIYIYYIHVLRHTHTAHTRQAYSALALAACFCISPFVWSNCSSLPFCDDILYLLHSKRVDIVRISENNSRMVCKNEIAVVCWMGLMDGSQFHEQDDEMIWNPHSNGTTNMMMNHHL